MLTAAKQEIRSKLEVICGIKLKIIFELLFVCEMLQPSAMLQSHSTFFSLHQSARQVTDAAQLEQLINEGKEAAAFLKTAIVQATASDKGHIGKKLELLVM